MRVHSLTALLLVTTISAFVTAEGQTADQQAGTWWRGLSMDSKQSFVAGYKSAMARSSEKLGHECSVVINSLDIRTLHPEAGKIGQVCAVVTEFDFEFAVPDLVSGVDDFYKNSEHTDTAIEVALQNVSDSLRKKRPPVGGIGGIPANYHH